MTVTPLCAAKLQMKVGIKYSIESDDLILRSIYFWEEKKLTHYTVAPLFSCTRPRFRRPILLFPRLTSGHVVVVQVYSIIGKLEVYVVNSKMFRRVLFLIYQTLILGNVACNSFVTILFIFEITRCSALVVFTSLVFSMLSN